jgi:hypothetical protein
MPEYEIPMSVAFVLENDLVKHHGQTHAEIIDCLNIQMILDRGVKEDMKR